MGHVGRGHLARLIVDELEVCPLEELPPGTVRIVQAAPLLTIGVYNCGGALYGLEDRCSHDDGPFV